MSRPAAKILLKQRIGQTHDQITVTEQSGYWIVVYNDQPVNLIRDSIYGFDSKKYIKNGWPNEHSAHTLAKKLNHWFMTEDFTVKRVL
mgnify:FL=1|jgi:hypothetical protein